MVLRARTTTSARATIGARLATTLGAAAIALGCLIAGPSVRPAAAQNVVVMVNGTPITSYDIEQRARLQQLVSHKSADRNTILEELIDEHLKIQAGSRYKVGIDDGDVNSSYRDMASRMNLSPDQLTATLGRGGVSDRTLKSKIRADLVWQQIVRGKFQSSFQFRDKDIIAAAESKRKDDQPIAAKISGYEYVLRPILFVVPQGASASVVEAKRRQAEALRARFEDCERGLPLARQLRNVAVRSQILKNSTELPDPLREMLDRTGVGKLTGPETTPNGIQMFAVCARHEVKLDDPALKKVRQEMFVETFEERSKQFLKELRSQAMIERK